MVALPDTHMPDAPLKYMNVPHVIDNAQTSNPLKRWLMATLGVSMVIAALGVWIVPVADGDMALRLVKLLFSVTMLIFGMLFISMLDTRNAEPEIHLDPHLRLLKIVEFDKSGNGHAAGTFKLDELSDITLRDRHLSARNAAGAQIVSVTVQNAGVEKSIRALLSKAV